MARRGEGNGRSPRTKDGVRRGARAKSPSFITAQAKAIFLTELRKLPNVARAAEISGHSRHQYYEIRKKDAEFAEQWEDALAFAVAEIEELARKRITDGVTTFRSYGKNGEVTSESFNFSEKLHIEMLRAHHHAYRPRREITGPGGGPVQMTLSELAEQARQSEDLGDGVEG